jgi:hypothetical protein
MNFYMKKAARWGGLTMAKAAYQVPPLYPVFSWP